ncbi:MAG: hypothetical protein ACREIQ_11195 [Nitrospiria bacterium]
MSENKVDWSVLDSLSAPFVGYVEDEATIRKDPSKGIAEDVKVPFTKPVWNVSDAEQASEAFTILGAGAFNGLLNYASDLRRRGNVAQVERARLTADPLKKELKQLAAFDFTEAAQDKYVELRRSGSSAKQALAAILS